ncbi:MAG: dTDP-4-dehydrorhamnose 3,5-epimerase [Bacteroidetes bacterium HGW-Bacteroidetes-19]|nr:MAG: dTDP-4-dehydrorhamnose 3,5-epimerase [Bacteroidetes bacterium HGW-Bacteroidetes-20]PKP28113.1 MAG: dTDP-4-dehydrorhamnose 3,5-epimerase [Bacteroidetes bacterium HGW-Bacteroidetes-19]
MEIINTPINQLIILKPTLFYDHRGYFFESYNQKLFKQLNIDYTFVQDNQSESKKGVIRGLHFQNPPFAQAKLVRVIQGEILDVAVDLRKESATFGQSYKVHLSGENQLQLLIPEGFAHGFVALEDHTIVHYKCSQFYNKEAEGTILYNDPSLNIDWEIDHPITTEKDLQGVSFKNYVSPF